MIVYVESNFVLEVAYEQEQCSSAERLLELAKLGKIQLVIPAFSLIEPLWTIRKKEHDSKSTLDLLGQLSHDLDRSRARKHLSDALLSVVESLKTIDQVALGRYQSLVQQLMEFGSRIDLTERLIMRSFELERRTGVKRFDATVLASILHDLEIRKGPEPKRFVSRDKEAFNRPAVRAELRALNCRFISDFAYAVRNIKGTAPKTSRKTDRKDAPL